MVAVSLFWKFQRDRSRATLVVSLGLASLRSCARSVDRIRKSTLTPVVIDDLKLSDPNAGEYSEQRLHSCSSGEAQ
jgi:hypothetical protein